MALLRRGSRLAAVVLLVGGRATWAQTAAPLPGAVTIEQVLDILEHESPRTQADRASLAVAQADRITARTLPNPSISYGAVHLVQGLSTGAVTQHQAVVEQPLLMFHQRDARVVSADLNISAEQARIAAQLAERRLAVRQAFASLLARQQQLQVLQESMADLERVSHLVEGRAEAGERSQYDVARIDTEAGTLRVQVMNAETDVEDAAGHLAALLGKPGWAPRATGRLDPGNVPTDVAQLWTVAQERKPSLVAMRREQASARGGLLLAQRERLPVPALSAGTQLTKDVTGTSVFVGVALPLPIFDRGRGPIAHANAEIDAANLALTAEMAEARAEIERAANVLAKRREALDRLETSVVDRAPKLRQMAEDAYREGSGEILDLLDAMRSLREIQLTHVQQLESTKLAEEEVVSAAALDVTPAAP